MSASRVWAATGSIVGSMLGGIAGGAVGYNLDKGRGSVLANESAVGFGILGAIVGSAIGAAAGAGCPEPKQIGVSGYHNPRFP